MSLWVIEGDCGIFEDVVGYLTIMLNSYSLCVE